MPRKKKVKYYSARRRGVYSRGEEINPLNVFNQHNWICFLCKKPIDPWRRVPDWYAATIEHIIPISKFGEHIMKNVAPAHLKCNNDRGNLPLDEYWEKYPIEAIC